MCVCLRLHQPKRNLRLDAGRKQLAAKLAKLKAEAAGGGPGAGDSGEYGISWGFDEDAVAEEEDDEGDGGENNDGEVCLVCVRESEDRRERGNVVGGTPYVGYFKSARSCSPKKVAYSPSFLTWPCVCLPCI